jgi:hypothetical protein
VNMVDLDTLSSEDLNHLRILAREREMREREAREKRIAHAAELLCKPTIGYYRRLRQEDPGS